MVSHYNDRLSGLRAKMSEAGVDALYVNHKENIRYFSGRKGDDCALYFTQDSSYIITDFRYREMAMEMSDSFEYVENTGEYTTLDFLKSRGEKVLGVEKDYLSLGDYLSFCELPGKEIKPVSGLIEDLRMIKTEDEIEATQKAAAIADKALLHMLDYLKPGISEKRAAAELEFAMKCEGADDLSFDTILVSGAGTSKPHGVPSDKLIEAGDFVTMDFGALYDGYHSDMTRTVAIGSASDEMKKIYDIVYKAQTNCCAKLKAGMTGIEGDALARDIIEEAGYGEFFGHGTGHSTGLEIHESPRLSRLWKGVLQPNMFITIEPGIYLPGKFGVRIEDLALIKADGIMNLCTSPKELIIL